MLPGTRSQRRPESLYHPAFLNDPLKDEVLKYANWSLSWNTNRTYTSGEKRFIQFCLMNRLTTPTGDILPASEGTLVYFASFLARTVRQSTIKIYLAAVRNLHIVSGYEDPLQGRLLLRKILRGILRYQGSPRIWWQLVTLGFVSYSPYLKKLAGAQGFLHDLGRLYTCLFRLSSL